MLGLRTSEEGPEHSVHLADNVRIVDHDVSVNAANNHRVIKSGADPTSEISYKGTKKSLIFPQDCQ